MKNNSRKGILNKKSVAQGTIEYLVSVAVVVVVSLLVVAVVSNNLDSFTGISSTSSKISSSSGIISISEAVLDNSGDGLINLSNTSGGLLTITGINVNGEDMNYDNVDISQGEEKYFSLSDAGSGCSCVGFEGKTKTCEVIVYAESEYGLEKQFTTSVSVDCVADASAVTLSSGAQLVLSTNEVITGFSFAGLDSGGSSTVNVVARTVDISVPFNADVANLTPVISTIPGVTVSPTGSQNFSSPVVYTITTSSGSTQTYTVSVNVLPSSATQLITDFNFDSLGSGVIAQENHTIIVTVPYGTDVNNLTPAITLVSGVTIDPTGPQNFSNPVIYTITASDDLNQTYTVTVNVLPNSAKAIIDFSFSDPVAVGDINESTHTITVMVPYGTSVVSLTPTIVISDDATINPDSGIAQNFTNPVTYTVTAQNDTTQDYDVTVTVDVAASALPYIIYPVGSGLKLYIHPTDNSTRGGIWGCYGTTIGAGAQSMTDGSGNTAAIVAGCSEEGIAAKLCSDLNFGGYDDWYLPAVNQLSAMYNDRNNVTKGDYTAQWVDFGEDWYYLASTEFLENSTIGCWVVYFAVGDAYGNYNKGYPNFDVRCVRSD